MNTAPHVTGVIRRFTALSARSAFLLLAGFAFCGSVVHAEAPSAPPGARVYFIEPHDGDTVKGEVTVKMGLSGMGIAPAGIAFDATGHHHLLVDLATPPDMNAPLPANAHVLHFGKGQTETHVSLPPGPHTLRLLLANYQHIPFSPPVISEPIHITVE